MNLWLRLLLMRVTASRRSRVDLFGQCVTPFRVLPGDLDLLRHMNNGRYLTVLDVARLDYIARSGLGPVLSAKGWYPVVTAETVAFHRALTLWERFTVTTSTTGWDERSLVLEQTFRVGRDGTGPVAAEAVVRALMLRRSGGRVPTGEMLEAAGRPAATPPPVTPWITAWAQAQDDLWARRRAGST